MHGVRVRVRGCGEPAVLLGVLDPGPAVAARRSRAGPAPDHPVPLEVPVRTLHLTNLRTGAPMSFTQANGSLTITGITSWDTTNGLAGLAHVASCPACSGGAKVAGIGNGAGNSVTVTVDGGRVGGDYRLTIVGSLAGTGSFLVSVNDAAATPVPMTDSGQDSPLVARSIEVQLRPGANRIRFANPTGSAPDLDRIALDRPG